MNLSIVVGLMVLLSVQPVIPELSCYDDKEDCWHYNKTGCDLKSDYPGYHTTTLGGLPCRWWDINDPYVSDNYCDIRGELGPWCFTANSTTVKWDYCIKKCECYDAANKCYHGDEPICRKTNSYTGTQNETLTGKPCVNWIEKFYTAPVNYCRVLGMDIPWCFVNDSQIFGNCFRRCNTSSTGCYDAANKCYHGDEPICRKTNSYTGTQNKTLTGKPCVNWINKGYTEPLNYCRLLGKDTPWCHVDDTQIWGYCFRWCNTTSDCYDSYGDCYKHDRDGCNGHLSYTGRRDKTVSGRTCQRWDKQEPHKHTFEGNENYCRTQGYSLPWCFTTDPAVGKEYCFEKC